MTIEKCRKIFGDKMAHLSDEEVASFIELTSVFCDGLLDMVLNKKISKDLTTH